MIVLNDDWHFSPCKLDVEEVIGVICHILKDGNFGTKVAALEWLSHMLTRVPRRTFQYVETFFPVLLETLSDESEEVRLHWVRGDNRIFCYSWGDDVWESW